VGIVAAADELGDASHQPAADVHPGRHFCIPGRWPKEPYLLHNNGCWLADLRDPAWHQTAPDGNSACYFAFPKRMFHTNNPQAPGGKLWMVAGESEDWFFSRRMHEAGIKSAITRKVEVGHDGGTVRWTNGDWGALEHDEPTRHNWGLENRTAEELAALEETAAA
jgi:hypothetical protein